MQPIERYGLIALLFLVVTVVAVVLWDRGERRADSALVAAAGAESAPTVPGGPANPREARAKPRSTVAQPPVAAPGAQRGSGLTALPTENLPAPGMDSPPAGSASAGPKTAGLASQLHHQRAAVEWILAISDPAERDRVLAELQTRPTDDAKAVLAELEARRAVAAPVTAPASSAVAVADTSSPSPLLEVADPRQRRPQDPGSRATAPGMGLAPMQVGAPQVAKVEGSTYTVKRGDTLSEVSQRLLGTSKRIDDIVALNPGLDPNNVPVGRVLRMPVPATAGPATASPSTSVAAAAPAPAASAAPTYVVQSGDSLFRIAAKHLGDGKRHGEIAALNPKLDPSRLQPGQRLLMPAAARALVAAPSSAPAAAAKPAPAAEAKPSSAVASAPKPAPASRSSSVQ